jgi:hypothetical protein
MGVRLRRCPVVSRGEWRVSMKSRDGRSNSCGGSREALLRKTRMPEIFAGGDAKSDVILGETRPSRTKICTKLTAGLKTQFVAQSDVVRVLCPFVRNFWSKRRRLSNCTANSAHEERFLVAHRRKQRRRWRSLGMTNGRFSGRGAVAKCRAPVRRERWKLRLWMRWT